MAIWHMIRDAVKEMGGKATIPQLKQYFIKNYSSIKLVNIPLDTAMITVNEPSRTHFNGGKKIRRTNTNNKYDCLFKNTDDYYEIYDPQKHGVWEIYKDENGKLSIRPIDETNPEDNDEHEDFSPSDFTLPTETNYSKQENVDGINNLYRNEEKESELLSKIPESMAEIENTFSLDVIRSMQSSKENRMNRLANTSKVPEIIYVQSKIYLRNPDVVAEILLRANGVCEQCYCNAPFLRAKDETPYLEVHHRKPLADGGEDSVNNAIALCPNCHRKAHYG